MLLIAGLLLLTAGCTVRFNTDVVINSDDTATVNIVVGVRFDGEIPPEAQGDMDQLDPDEAAGDIQDLADQCGFDADAVTAGEYTEDDFMGAEITLADIPLSAVNCFLGEDSDSPFESWSLTREGDDYVFNAVAPPLAGVAGGLGGQKRQVAQLPEGFPTDLPTDLPTEALEALEDAASELEDALGDLPSELDDLGGLLDAGAPEIEARVSITFPGEVREHNADSIEGNTVTWDLQLESPTTMMAVGAASGGGASSLLLPIIIAVVVILLLLIAFFVIRSRRSTPTPAFGGVPGAAGPQGGFGAPPGGAPQGGFGAPPGGAPQGGFGGPPGGGQPPQGQPPGGFGGPPGGGQPPQGQPPGGFGGPPGGGQPPQGQPQGQQAPPPQPAQPPGDQGGGGGFDAGSTRTFRPEDLLPPQDPDNR